MHVLLSLERRVIRSHRQQKISSTDDFATLLVLVLVVVVVLSPRQDWLLTPVRRGIGRGK